MGKTKVFQVSFMTCLILSLTVMAPPVLASEAKAIKLKVADAWGDMYPPVGTNIIVPWMNAVEKAAGGRIKFHYLGGPEAFSPFELPDYIQRGTLDVGHTCCVYHTSSLPEIELISFVRHQDQNSEFFRSSGILDLVSEALMKRKRIVFLSRISFRDDSFLWSNKPITTADWSGYKIRAAGPLIGTFLEKMKASPTVIASAEVRDALSRGILDGQLRPPHIVHDMKEYESVPYCLGPSFVTYGSELIISGRKWNEIPKDLQKIIIDTTAKLEKSNLAHQMVWLRGKMETMMQTLGVTYHQLSPAEYEHSKKAWKVVWDKVFTKDLDPRWISRAEKILEGHALWDKSYPNEYGDLAK